VTRHRHFREAAAGATCRAHVVATLFGQVRVRLPRFRCAGCDGIEAGFGWPSHCRSTPELDQLQAHLSALMPYRVAADLLEQFSKGRDYAAWVGLTPSQHSTGGKQKLGTTPKMDERTLRRLWIIGASSVLQ
jgi:hypothetical protein